LLCLACQRKIPRYVLSKVFTTVYISASIPTLSQVGESKIQTLGGALSLVGAANMAPYRQRASPSLHHRDDRPVMFGSGLGGLMVVGDC
jgi:hypothetical protein